MKRESYEAISVIRGMEISPEGEQLLSIYSSVHRISGRCFRLCDFNLGVPQLDASTQKCLRACIESWVDAKKYVSERFDEEQVAVLRYNKGLEFSHTDAV